MKKEYFPEIDGLRFYTFQLILLNHTGVLKIVEGHTFFFTLSGFLISYTTFKKLSSGTEFNLREYLLKRILRTFPLYFLIVIFCGILYLIVTRLGVKISMNNYWTFFFFVQNYFGYGNIFILANLWAMAVTEQLYFGWGVLCNFLQQKLMSLLPVVLVASFVFNVVIHHAVVIQYPNTVNYISVFLIGCMCSAIHYYKPIKTYLFNLSQWQSNLLFLFGLLICTYGFTLSISNEVYYWRVYVLSIGFSFVILSLCYTNYGFKFIFTNKAVRYMGKISYGLYCYHAIVLTGFTQFLLHQNLYLQPGYIFLVTLILTILVSILSYEYFEKWFIKKKMNMQYSKALQWVEQ